MNVADKMRPFFLRLNQTNCRSVVLWSPCGVLCTAYDKKPLNNRFGQFLAVLGSQASAWNMGPEVEGSGGRHPHRLSVTALNPNPKAFCRPGAVVGRGPENSWYLQTLGMILSGPWRRTLELRDRPEHVPVVQVQEHAAQHERRLPDVPVSSRYVERIQNFSATLLGISNMKLAVGPMQ